MAVQGTAVFDGIAVGSLEASFMGTNKTLKAKAAFINTKTGQTHGFTEKSDWSPVVLAKMKELVDAMEVELAAVHFGGSGVHQGNAKGVDFKEDAGGLGEHLSGDAPSI